MATALQRIREIAQATGDAKPKVALDTCCVQYYIGDPPAQPWADCLDPVFQAGIKQKVELYVSTVVVSELLSHVHFANRHRTGYDPELDLLGIINRHFQMLDVNGDVAKAAGRLRGNYVPGNKITLKTPDALIGATSLANGHTVFITNDAQLAKALPEDNCVYLREAVLQFMAERFPQACLDTSNSIQPTRRAAGLPANPALANSSLGSVRLDPPIPWRRLLADAFTVAAAIAEPCVFFLPCERKGQRIEAKEILFWHDGLRQTRPPEHILRCAEEHLGYSRRTGQAENPKSYVWVYCFSSLAREKARQSDPAFASKSDCQRLADALSAYLVPLWRFRSGLTLPQTTWIFSEDGVARYLKTAETRAFLDQARNVFGWEDGR